METKIFIHQTQRNKADSVWCDCSNCKEEVLMAKYTLYHAKYCPLCGAEIKTKEYDKKENDVFTAIEDSFRESAWKSHRNGKFTW